MIEVRLLTVESDITQEHCVDGLKGVCTTLTRNGWECDDMHVFVLALSNMQEPMAFVWWQGLDSRRVTCMDCYANQVPVCSIYHPASDAWKPKLSWLCRLCEYTASCMLRCCPQMCGVCDGWLVHASTEPAVGYANIGTLIHSSKWLPRLHQLINSCLGSRSSGSYFGR